VTFSTLGFTIEQKVYSYDLEGYLPRFGHEQTAWDRVMVWLARDDHVNELRRECLEALRLPDNEDIIASVEPTFDELETTADIITRVAHDEALKHGLLPVHLEVAEIWLSAIEARMEVAA
jgi:hypothetical protein